MARIKKEFQPPARRSERIETAKAVRRSKEETEAKITKPNPKAKRFRRPRQRKTCRLLALPGELRNAIYRYALLDPKRIYVTSKGPGQPALLKTCRRIRNEARDVYYGENDFILQVVDFNGAAFVPFDAQSWLWRGDASIRFNFLGSPDWGNLVAWMKAHDACGALIPDMYKRVSDELDGIMWDSNDYIISAAIRLVHAMRYLPWSTKEEALQALYEGLKGTRSRWVKKEDRVRHL